MVVIGVDMNHFDAQFFQPLAADRAFVSGVNAAGRLGVAGPEDHHLTFLQTVLDGAVAFRRAQVHALSPVMHGPPVPAFPTVRVVGHGRPADVVEKPQPGAQPVPRMPQRWWEPLPFRMAPGPWSLFTRLISPATISRASSQLIRSYPETAPILRVPLALRVKIDPFHGIEEPVRRIDHRLENKRMGRYGRFPGRGKGFPPGLDRPGRRVFVVEFDGGDADDLAVLHVDEYRAAVGVARVSGDTLSHVRAEPEAGARA